jgi:DUF1365 family protein
VLVAVKGLTVLEGEISALDPRKADFSKKGFLGLFFNPFNSYFAKYKDSEVKFSDFSRPLLIP